METDTVAADPEAPTDSFESFYAASADRVYRALAVTLGDPHLAREATDEAMARAFVRWRQVAGVDNPGGWVFRVGLNWATSWRRKLRRERVLPDTERGLPPIAMPEPDGSDAVAALSRLTVDARAVVVCRVLFDLSTAETAAVLQVAEGTVRSRLSRALTVLRRELREEEPMTGTDFEIPAALTAAVRTTAAEVPPSLPDVGAVRTRARRIRRRRAVVRAAVALVVIAALVASYPAVRARALPDVVDGGPVGPHPIGLWQNRDRPPQTAGIPPGNHVPGSSGEIAAQLRQVDGRNAVTAVSDRQPGLGRGGYMGPAPLPGGGLATIGSAATSSKTSFGPRTVVVVDADGRTVSSHPYPEDNGRTTIPRPMPMTGNATTLFWWSFERNAAGAAHPVLVTYDIATGRLRNLAPAVGGNGYELPYLGMQATDTRLISFPAVGGGPCSADIADTATGEPVTSLRPVIAGCSDVYFALSPDNQHAAALVTYRDKTNWNQRVFVLDVGTGRIQKKFTTPALAKGTDRSQLVSGIDWAGDKTIRYARGTPGGSDPILLRLRL